MVKLGMFPAYQVVAILAGLGCLAAGCGPRRQMPKVEPPTVTVAPALEREVVDFDTYTGHVEAISSVDVYAQVSGYLEKVEFQDGAMVKEGELLFEIDKRTYQAEYDTAVARKALVEAQDKLAKTTLARDQKLVDKGAISQEAYDQAVAAADEAAAQIQSATAQIAAAKVNLDYCTISSPIDGRIDRTFVTKGNLVQSGIGSPTLLTTIVSVDPVYVYFDIDELALLKYMEEHGESSKKPDDSSLRERKIPVEISLSDGTVYPHLGVIDFGSNQLSAGTGTLSIRAIVPNPEGMLRPGMFARVRVAAGPPYQAVLAPQGAVGADQNMRFVYGLDDKGNAVRRTVTLGTKQGPLQVIKTGLKQGEKVIINGTVLVRVGKPVKAEEGKMPEPPPIDENLVQKDGKSNTPPTTADEPAKPDNAEAQPQAPPMGSN
ncbi:efflux RND transporter periplasmic adaptor subunit [Blastopirellula marina]|uniref:Efflux transporter periplasmic adaptor subunit n=1 Tax=Blastopirellula marina TaxID=124 RepID=A0A2S8GM15_9BACT|nr:efflux RND transporter periplasmic adaptor subunit [Blastopirellula marina]PQO45470.1 efflux transporter periplasmic adaptor subunit [Blastopirellula marina]